jgi:hypothetical protein
MCRSSNLQFKMPRPPDPLSIESVCLCASLSVVCNSCWRKFVLLPRLHCEYPTNSHSTLQIGSENWTQREKDGVSEREARQWADP